MKYPSAVLSFTVGEPRFETSREEIHVHTHLQKYSPFGFMLTLTMWKLIPVPTFHFWLFWKRQEGNDILGWIPGTERGFYFRTPGFRWDAELGMKRTLGYFPSGHWD